MEQTLMSLESQKNWKEFIKKSCRKNKISIQIAAFFTPIKIRILYDRLLKTIRINGIFFVKSSQTSPRVYSSMNPLNWSMKNLQKTETGTKNKHKIKTPTNGMISPGNSTKSLKIDISGLENSAGKGGSITWIPIKKGIFLAYFRGQWDEDEDRIIVKYIVNHGRRWSKIAKELGNHRTQHMVKNRFKTLIIRQKKITPKTSNETTLLNEIGFQLFGQCGVPIQKRMVIKEQNESSESDENNMSLEEHDQVKISEEAEKKIIRKTNILIPRPIEDKDTLKADKKENQVKKVYMGFEEYNGGRDKFMMEDCSKGLGAVSTPMSSYDIQQIYSPYYLSYQGVTPYLSPSSSVSVPFFMNTPINATINAPSFSAFDNTFNQNLFLCPGFTSAQAPGSNYPQ